ncbi:hypothetical protein F5X96DRAFT_650006, partial [Biscogniauxia mediterranea]
MFIFIGVGVLLHVWMHHSGDLLSNHSCASYLDTKGRSKKHFPGLFLFICMRKHGTSVMIPFDTSKKLPTYLPTYYLP